MLRLGAKVKLCPQCSEKIMCRAFGFQVEVSNERWILKNRVKREKKRVERMGMVMGGRKRGQGGKDWARRKRREVGYVSLVMFKNNWN